LLGGNVTPRTHPPRLPRSIERRLVGCPSIAPKGLSRSLQLPQHLVGRRVRTALAATAGGGHWKEGDSPFAGIVPRRRVRQRRVDGVRDRPEIASLLALLAPAAFVETRRRTLGRPVTARLCGLGLRASVDATGRVAAAPGVASRGCGGQHRRLVGWQLLDTLRARSSHSGRADRPQLGRSTALSRTFGWAIGASIA
jgi:hypothetical protein